MRLFFTRIEWDLADFALDDTGFRTAFDPLAVEFGKQGLRCNAVNPGSIQTAMSGGGILPEDADMRLMARTMSLSKPMGPGVVAGVIAMLASDDGIHINGEEIRVDGGTLA